MDSVLYGKVVLTRTVKNPTCIFHAPRIHTGLQPGDLATNRSEPFQRLLAESHKPLKRWQADSPRFAALKRGAGEIGLNKCEICRFVAGRCDFHARPKTPGL
ncbi:MAG: hypothetical protein N3I86_00790 [Verrucomicrobiae bacterium]|nr:hypothetical protein [Verrucomicrobiae bacterium]MDW8307965.1 hypothetical protein [Verrucomicrobiales bacterium]